MKKLAFFIFLILLVVGGIYAYMRYNGHTNESIINTVKHIELKANCAITESTLIGSAARVTVQNLSGKDRENVQVRIIAYDTDGAVIQQKDRSILRPVLANGSISKIVTLPKNAASCNCIILSSEE